MLLATRIEDASLPTVLGYGHGDVIHGLEEQWTKGKGPWCTARDGERLYGRGTADNKGQHTINMAALEAVKAERGGRLGFNAKFIIEMGEEAGSRGLAELVASHKPDFAADVFVASDGPRVKPQRPTLSLGCRGALNFDLVCDLREGAHHSGNWGGLIANPGIILAHALASISGAKGELLIKALQAPPMSPAVKEALADVEIDAGEAGPAVDAWWGEPGHTPAERVYAANVFNVLAFSTGTPGRPVNAIPPKAVANCQLRFVAGTDIDAIMPALQQHLEAGGFGSVQGDTAAAVQQWRVCGNAHGARSSLGAVRLHLLATLSQQQTSVDPADRGLDLQRCLYRHPGFADDLDPSLLCRLFPARARRAHPHAAHALGSRAYGGALLGHWRGQSARAQAKHDARNHACHRLARAGRCQHLPGAFRHPDRRNGRAPPSRRRRRPQRFRRQIADRRR